MKKLGVIILNWNGLELLKRFLPDAVRFTISSESDLIVADNGSEDGSVAWVEKNLPMVKLIRLERNYGFAEGYNRAIAQADYKYVTLLNSDVEVTPGWWQPLLEYMETHPATGAIQPKILSQRDKSFFEYAGAAGGYLDRLGYPYCRGRLFDCIEKDEGQYDNSEPVDVCWASGACLTTRRDLYLSLGGLDPLFFAHMEEIDYCCRLHNAGYKVKASSASAVYHVGGASLAQGSPKKTYLNFRNNLLLLHKNLPEKRGRRVLFERRLADTLAFGMFLVKGEFSQAKAILRAHRDFRRMKKGYTEFPAQDILSLLPGSDRSAVMERYLFRHDKIVV